MSELRSRERRGSPTEVRLAKVLQVRVPEGSRHITVPLRPSLRQNASA